MSTTVKHTTERTDVPRRGVFGRIIDRTIKSARQDKRRYSTIEFIRNTFRRVPQTRSGNMLERHDRVDVAGSTSIFM